MWEMDVRCFDKVRKSDSLVDKMRQEVSRRAEGIGQEEKR